MLNKEKMKQVIHYIVHKCQNKSSFGKTVLYKLMYFSDFNHYELHETPITGETYIKRQHGPIPNNFDRIYEELVEENKINLQPERVIDYVRHRNKSSKKPDTSLLSEDELEVIDTVIEDLSHMNAAQISEYSHGDRPWRIAKYKEALNPEAVFYRSDKYSVREYDE